MYRKDEIKHYVHMDIRNTPNTIFDISEDNFESYSV